MSYTVSVSTLSRDESYERQIKIRRERYPTVKDVKRKLSRELHIAKERFDLMRLSEGVLLEDSYHMTDAEWGDGLCLIVHPECRVALPYIVTGKEDMINGTMEDDTRILMSCEHAITPCTLYDYCYNMLKQGKTEFTCPYVDASKLRSGRGLNACQTSWTLYEVDLKARLTDDERVLFEMLLSRNSLRADQGIQQCPFCGSLSARVNVSNKRVRCRTCTLKTPNRCEFCWECLHQWKTANTEYCGNLECVTAKGPKAFQDILSTCGTKTIDEYRGVPSVRFCIQCKSLVEHTTGCKKMTCAACRTQFCFVCLRDWSSSGCGYGKQCNRVAGVQKVPF